MPAPSTPPRIPSPSPASEFASEEPPTERHIYKPSQHIIDLLEGQEHTSNHPSDPVVTCGIQTPTEVPNIELEGEGQANSMMATNFTPEYALVAESSESEALEPYTLTETKCHPDWPLWKRAIEKELDPLSGWNMGVG